MFRIKVSKSDLSDLDVLSDYPIENNLSKRSRVAFHQGLVLLKVRAWWPTSSSFL